MSIAAMEREMRNQVEDLPNFAALLRRQKFPVVHPSNLVFTGSGDSYAAALFARELSGGVALAADPYELSEYTGRLHNKHVIIISVSGRTRANIELAKRLRGIAESCTAVTASLDSPLARMCNRMIALNYRSAGVLTSGTTSFTTSLLVCARFLGRLPRNLALQQPVRSAVSWASKLRGLGTGDFIFAGSGVQYALAKYGAFKIQEILGCRAEAELPEQFGHSHVFSINKEADNIFGILGGRDSKTKALARILNRNGFRAYTIASKAQDPVRRCLEISFHLQNLALRLARDRKMEQVAFLSDGVRLRLSNQLIY